MGAVLLPRLQPREAVLRCCPCPSTSVAPLHPPRHCALRYLRLPSTWCEQQQFEALLNDLDSDLLMRLALGQWCAGEGGRGRGLRPLGKAAVR